MVDIHYHRLVSGFVREEGDYRVTVEEPCCFSGVMMTLIVVAVVTVSVVLTQLNRQRISRSPKRKLNKKNLKSSNHYN